MRRAFSLALIGLLAWSGHHRISAAPPPSAHTLPIVFLHGYASNAAAGDQLKANLSTPLRPFVSLTGCENECSTRSLPVQLDLAIRQIRTLQETDARFANGYVLMGMSQGGALVRGIATEMDDHKIHTLVSIAGAANGLFYGPQASDILPAHGFRDVLAAIMTNQSVFDYTQYSDTDIASGRMAIDWVKLHAARPELQADNAGYNLYRSPVKSAWVKYNVYWPRISNLDATVAEADQARRKRNFLRLQAAHFFASPVDAAVSPWQSAVLGAYEDVPTIEALETQFASLRVLPMEETQEYVEDSYGLATLHKRGALHRHVVENVSHGCWIMDEVPYNGTVECKFVPVFEKTLYPLLRPLQAACGSEQA